MRVTYCCNNLSWYGDLCKRRDPSSLVLINVERLRAAGVRHRQRPYDIRVVLKNRQDPEYETSIVRRLATSSIWSQLRVS